ncbi:multicopper oxidase family protein [Calidithermus timidus]|jgi:FtsP/CotA-like multicopper oxidase with cupredoxin domain|uniref:multicopper oxidase family protein n=1 Tax=Calidithermus timidus TaxID=307124 RepID=UPI000381565D|nr:multicopper oxidase family protein [Calidithermus timidus]
MNRRELLKYGALGLASSYGLFRLPAFAQSPFPQPRTLEVRRADGVVEAQITARQGNLILSGKPARLMTYGGFPGPILRVREGETVRLNFTNNLPEPTNLHLHGLHVPPSVDDPLAVIPPGESRLYEFAIPKGSAGTYWYHPHLHGRVAEQLYAGLAGLLVVEGPMDALPELKGAEEHFLVLKDWAFSGDQIPAWTQMDWMNGREGNLLTVNAAVRPTLRAQKATLRLRLLNASNARYYRLALENHPLYLIATDGGFLEKPVELTELPLAPGERAEVLVRLSRPGNYRLQALPYDRGAMMMHGSMNGMRGDQGMGQGMGGMGDAGMMGPMMGMGATHLETLLTLVAPANPKPLPLPASLAPVEPLEPSRAAATRRLVLGERMMQAEFFINDRMFDPGRVDIQAKLGTLEVWEIVNKTDMDHPFHLHTYPFQVLSRDGKPAPYRAWKDTVNLRKNETVRIAVPLRDFSGVTVYHCHIVEHEDRGMMGVLEVRP